MKYQNPQIERDLEEIIKQYGTLEEFKRTRPDYHLYEDLQESLPKFNRQINKLSQVDWKEWEKKARTI